jgi:hypothetical protein
MSNDKNMHNELSPRLQQMLAAYGNTPDRDPNLARRTQAKFMAELDQVFVGASAHKSAAGWAGLATWLSKLNVFTGGRIPSIGKRTLSYGLILLIVFGLFLFGSAGMTASAASSSLPGDPLYLLKTATESVQARLIPDGSVAQTRLYLDFAGRRLVEIQALIRAERFDDIHQAASEFERDIRKSLGAVESLSQIQPETANVLKLQMATVLRGYSAMLTQMLGAVPVDVQPALQRAAHVSKAAADLLNAQAADDDGWDAGGRGGDDNCSTPLPQTRDDDHCRTPSQGAGNTIQNTPSPSSVPETRPTQSERDDDNGSSNGGGDNNNDDSDDDDDGDDDGSGDDDNDDGDDDD